MKDNNRETRVREAVKIAFQDDNLTPEQIEKKVQDELKALEEDDKTSCFLE